MTDDQAVKVPPADAEDDAVRKPSRKQGGRGRYNEFMHEAILYKENPPDFVALAKEFDYLTPLCVGKSTLCIVCC
jgi:hypothetical protein